MLFSLVLTMVLTLVLCVLTNTIPPNCCSHPHHHTQACPPLEGPGAAAQAWTALATARGMLPPPSEHLSRLVVHDLLPKLLRAVEEGITGLGAETAHALMPLHMAWLLEALREALLCILESQVGVDGWDWVCGGLGGWGFVWVGGWVDGHVWVGGWVGGCAMGTVL